MWRTSVHWYPVTIRVPTVLWLNVGRLQWALYLWPWEEPDDDGRHWRLWAFQRGGWPLDWQTQTTEIVRDGERVRVRVYPRPIFRFITLGPVHVRYFRHRDRA